MESRDSLSIYESIIGYLNQRGVDIQKLAAIATDGAAVMRGKENGVVARLKREVKAGLVDFHCSSRCLALMMTKSSKANAFMKDFDDNLRNFTFITENSRTGKTSLRFRR